MYSIPFRFHFLLRRAVLRLKTPLRRSAMALGSLTLCLGLCLSLMLCTWCDSLRRTDAALRADTLRLHIRAAGNSVWDQTVKLAVRDAVLETMARLCTDAENREAAQRRVLRNLPCFELAAQRALAALHCCQAVRLDFSNLYFDTRQYPGFTLPAGRYDALRITLGSGAHPGRNWWCVLYPGLCMTACSGYDLQEENDLVAGNCILRFRVVELWHQLTAPREELPLLLLPEAHSPPSVHIVRA